MCIFSFFKKKTVSKKDEIIALTGAEAVHNSGLRDQEAAGSKLNPSLRKEALKDEGKNSEKPVH